MAPAIDAAYQAEYKKIWAECPDPMFFAAYMHKNPMMHWLFWKRPEVALELAGDVKGKKIFDFGCGSGVLMKHLYKSGAIIRGCDLDPTAALKVVETMKIKADIRYSVEEVTKLGEKYDRIFALDVLEHVDELDYLIDHIITNLADDGHFILSGPTESAFYRLGRVWARNSSPNPQAFNADNHLRTIYDIERRLEEKGMKRIETRRLYFPVTLFRISSWKK